MDSSSIGRDRRENGTKSDDDKGVDSEDGRPREARLINGQWGGDTSEAADSASPRGEGARRKEAEV